MVELLLASNPSSAPLLTYVSLGKLFCLTFCRSKMGNKKAQTFMGLLWVLNELIHVKCLGPSTSHSNIDYKLSFFFLSLQFFTILNSVLTSLFFRKSSMISSLQKSSPYLHDFHLSFDTAGQLFVLEALFPFVSREGTDLIFSLSASLLAWGQLLELPAAWFSLYTAWCRTSLSTSWSSTTNVSNLS